MRQFLYPFLVKISRLNQIAKIFYTIWRRKKKFIRLYTWVLIKWTFKWNFFSQINNSNLLVWMLGIFFNFIFKACGIFISMYFNPSICHVSWTILFLFYSTYTTVAVAVVVWNANWTVKQYRFHYYFLLCKRLIKKYYHYEIS